MEIVYLLTPIYGGCTAPIEFSLPKRLPAQVVGLLGPTWSDQLNKPSRYARYSLLVANNDPVSEGIESIAQVLFSDELEDASWVIPSLLASEGFCPDECHGVAQPIKFACAVSHTGAFLCYSQALIKQLQVSGPYYNYRTAKL